MRRRKPRLFQILVRQRLQGSVSLSIGIISQTISISPSTKYQEMDMPYACLSASPTSHRTQPHCIFSLLDLSSLGSFGTSLALVL